MQQLNPSEISDIIKGRIQGLDVTAEAQNEGTIVGVSDGIVRIHGLADGFAIRRNDRIRWWALWHGA